MGSLTMTAALLPRGPAAAFVLDDDQVAELGEGAKRFAVVARINDTTLRLTVARMKGEFLVGLSRANRETAGVRAGDTVTVTLTLDDVPRDVEVPAALAAALETDSTAKTAYDDMAYSHRKEFVRWIEEAKREETRARRVTQAIEMLREGRTRS